MKTYKGISVSPGIAEGKVFLFQEDKLSIPKYNIAITDVNNELSRFFAAVENAIGEINNLKVKYAHQMAEEEKKMLDSHILMLNDPVFKEDIGKKVEEKQLNVEWILLQVIENIIEKVNSSSDSYLKERSTDIHDVSQRVMRNLLLHERMSLADLDEEVIIIAHNLLPSDAISMNKKMVKGIAVDLGSKTSHTAIIAKSFAIPAVLGLSNLSQQIKPEDTIIVDGNQGVVIVNPDSATKKQYRSSQVKWQQHEKELQNLNRLKAETLDKRRIMLVANIEVTEEVASVIAHGADGIGLFRSEFLYMTPDSFPTEEEQLRTYKTVLEGMKGKSVTIRTLDLGGEKVMPGFNVSNEDNPILGWRAVRFCLAKPEIFKTQLRAMLRASVYGNLRIMFPMISGIEELLKTLDILDQLKKELSKAKIPFKKDIPVGVMIEVPSAALISEILAKKVDFFSIGTNDLIQYTIAVDRNNERIAYLYEPFHPGVLRLLKMIIDNAHEAGIPVGMCGEMAGDPFAAVVLLGLGLDQFSMSAYSIPEIKRIVRSVSMQEAKELAHTVMKMQFSQDIDDYVRDWMEAKFDLVSY
ncbi:MAG: phosphoenolpyruvate--protein phosphotransferase [Spirochaetales bacterium]|nr:phosphoenolpyruvate--protein phosphotransferase [Spirochaetales bacterium]